MRVNVGGAEEAKIFSGRFFQGVLMSKSGIHSGIHSRNERIREIIQILPVPDYLTPLVSFNDNAPAYEDAISCGWTVCYALVDDGYGGEVEFYCMDPFGAGELGDIPVRLVPTVYCKDCGARMIPRAAYNLGPVEYSCRCGVEYSDKNGWGNKQGPKEQIGGGTPCT